MNPPTSPPPRAGLAIGSLVLGLLGFLLSLLVVGGLFCLVGLALGGIHLARRQGRNGMAWIGMVFSVLGLAVSVPVGILAYNFITSEEFKEARENLQRPAPVTENAEFAGWHGVSAPDFSVTTLDGQTLKLSELKGRRVVLDFWATWCPPCVREIPHFIKLRQETPAEQLVIVGISAEDTETLKSFVKKNRINYPIASTDSLPAPYKDVRGIPTTFFLDRNGVIQSVLVGYHDFDVLKANALAADFAGEPKRAP